MGYKMRHAKGYLVDKIIESQKGQELYEWQQQQYHNDLQRLSISTLWFLARAVDPSFDKFMDKITAEATA